jgi:hypothetical protein
MKRKEEKYAEDQITYILSQPRYVIFIVFLAVIAVAGWCVRLSFGEDYAWISLLGMILMFSGSALLAFRIHKLAGSPTSDDLIE